jgi:transitional endoplasmic reticulum ATPase
MARYGQDSTSQVEEQLSQMRDILKTEFNIKEVKTADESVKDEILATLRKLGGLTVGDDSLQFKGTQFVLPANMKGNIRGAVEYLRSWDAQQNKTFEFTRVFNFRPWDGAHAFEQAMIKHFGTVGTGKTIPGNFFTPEQKPQYVTVNVSHNETIQVPWGAISFAPLDATFFLHGSLHEDYGQVFAIQVEAPRKYRREIEAFFALVEQELRTNSIYRGKAFTGGDNPQFINTKDVDPNKVVYSQDVMTQLETNMWSLLRYSDEMRKNRLPLKRAVLLEGQYGTGKTLAGQLTAKEAEENGWTFILARTGKDNLNQVLQTAQLYAPAVVWYEDIDIVAKGKSNEQVSRLLDSLDGITNKGVEILAGFTTNHIEEIQKGVLRPGRLDSVIHVGELDNAGFERLTKSVIPEHLRGDIDYVKVAEAMHGYLPAFAKEAMDRAIRYSISRNQGRPDVIHTQDLVNAAEGLRTQWQLMHDAEEGVPTFTLDNVVKGVVEQAVHGAKILDGDGDEVGGEWHLDTRAKFTDRNEG